MTHNYHAKPIDKIDNGKGYWNYQIIGVFDGDTKVGEYQYNYHSGCPFYAFEQNGEWFALACVEQYTALKIMKLPSCEVIGGEEPHSGGFCSIEVYVPRYYECQISEYTYRFFDDAEAEEKAHPFYADFAFRSGCVWGDDTSWKLEMLDISQAHKGILEIKDIGYIELAPDLKLRDCLRLDWDDCDKVLDMKISTQLWKSVPLTSTPCGLDS